MDARYFSNMPVPSEILTDNGGQFITDRWSEYANERGFSNQKTSPYNPQSNPVERVICELGRIVRLYAHNRQSTWDRVIERAEKTINSTAHRNTGFCRTICIRRYERSYPVIRAREVEVNGARQCRDGPGRAVPRETADGGADVAAQGEITQRAVRPSRRDSEI